MESENNYYRTSDLKLYAFLRTVSPDSFVGVNKADFSKVTFLFKHSQKLVELANGYWRGDEFTLSPLQLGMNLDLGKTLIFGDSSK